jgi:hypothetical protein
MQVFDSILAADVVKFVRKVKTVSVYVPAFDAYIPISKKQAMESLAEFHDETLRVKLYPEELMIDRPF